MIALVVVSSAMVTAAQSADNFALIQAVHGKILINKGKGFESAAVQTPLNIGDRILISTKSAITISYIDAGCSTTLDKPLIYKVAKSVPCSGELISNSISGAPIIAPLGGGLGTAALGVGASAGIPSVGWGVTLVVDPIIPASLP